MTSNCPYFNTLCLIHSQKKELSESFLSKRILELKCCLGSGIFTAAVKRGVAPHTRKQRVLAAISKLRSALFTGYKNKICTYYIYYIPHPLTVHFSMTRSVRYQPILLHTLYYTLHTEHAYCLSYRFLNDVVITPVIEMVEMVEILDGRLGKRSVVRVRYVINNLLHLVIVKYGDISLVLGISTRLRLVTILSLLVKYLVILHADPCNKSYNIFTRNVLLSAQMGERASVVLICITHTSRYNEVK